jgi:hypothetical protein
MTEAKKHNPPKTVAKAVLKANRDMDIEDHGKPTAFRKTMTKNQKAYSRKGKNKFQFSSNDIMEMVESVIREITK